MKIASLEEIIELLDKMMEDEMNRVTNGQDWLIEIDGEVKAALISYSDYEILMSQRERQKIVEEQK